ncbi:MDR family MFS transporter [Corynebacterium cystitidis]|uniref:Drug resistance transporter, EmrB/QacA subfamily n=1 Tax=Corynebacterium cystitidis DSM 20524 TaxID=1121357 RepID=A0A1H9RF15_9CORY|nr:MDR family MFS transporter [Corynebacterium cystitidis]WJY81452.1 Multidrug export protein EmrB [Corynebacterium cystitidis DSM 20524]SER71421.1 drug resistance transporter, EmrB/QacA subfamily [Corynebacterium cystitidis DSM 20524]SNV87323.1 drug resistance transporter, EmrB/QacA subfamily protein [Corynebacterium cystitidis]
MVEKPGEQVDGFTAYPTRWRRFLLICVLLVGDFAMLLNQTLMMNAVPAFMGAFRISAEQAHWVTTLFMLVAGIMVPVSAYLIGRFTTRQLFIGAMALFATGTIIAALAASFAIVLLGRVLQAAATGMMMPLVQTVLFSIFPEGKRGSAMGIFGLLVGFAPALGPWLSGLILNHYHWSSLFWLMLPFAVLAAILALFFLKNVTRPGEPSLDMFSVALSTIGFGAFLYGFSVVGHVGWFSAEALIPIVVGIVGVVWFFVRQLQLEQPLLRIDVLSNPQYALNNVLGMLVIIIMNGTIILLPVYLQQGRGVSPLDSGLVLLPGAVVLGLLSPIAGKLFDHWGARWLGLVGFMLMLVANIASTKFGVTTALWTIALWHVVRMAGVAMVMMPVSTAALNQLAGPLIPHGAAVNNVLRQIAGALGAAVLVSVMSNSAVELYDGIGHAFCITVGLALLGVVGAWMIKPACAEAGPTSKRKTGKRTR